jgi:hypothetical protein
MNNKFVLLEMLLIISVLIIRYFQNNIFKKIIARKILM